MSKIHRRTFLHRTLSSTASLSFLSILSATKTTKAAGFLRGTGDVRRINLYMPLSGERIDVIYWIDGDYISEALAEISFVCRDLETNEVKTLDWRIIDMVAAVQKLLQADDPLLLVSGYRTLKTSILTSSDKEPMRESIFHLRGQALDIRSNRRSGRQISMAGRSTKAGGVTNYENSNYVHLDVGPLNT